MKRIIPCLDVYDGRVVKGIKFVELVDVGDPVNSAKIYDEQGADEVVFLDISATNEKRKTRVDFGKKTVANIDIPLTVGGGISTIEDVRELLSAGASKVSINSAALSNPNLITEVSREFGKDRLVVAIDVKKTDLGEYHVVSHGGQRDSGKNAIDWAKKVEELGAGEILLTSMDADGTKAGYDIDITKEIANAVKIPVIASGGCGSLEHFKDAFLLANADGALAASIFHFGEVSVKEVKAYLKENGVDINLFNSD